MAKGGLKPPKPRPTKEATLTDISQLLQPDVYERLGPIGTMNMIQTMATAAKIPEVTGLPALADEPLLPALAGEPKAQKKVQRRVSEAKTGLESPKRRELLKAARDVAGATMVPVPTSVKDVLIQQVAKPAMKAIPDSSIQAAIASKIRPMLVGKKFKSLVDKMEKDVYGDSEERYVDTYDPTPFVSDEYAPTNFAAAVAESTGLPATDVAAYFERNKLDPRNVILDYATDHARARNMDMDEALTFGEFLQNDEGLIKSFKDLAKQKKLGKYVNLDDLADFNDLLVSRYKDYNIGPTKRNLAKLIGEQEAQRMAKGLETVYEDSLDDTGEALYNILQDGLGKIIE